MLRRWVVTGTPAPAGGGTEVARLRPLLTFLGHPAYGTAEGKQLWDVRLLPDHDSSWVPSHGSAFEVVVCFHLQS